MKKRLFILAIVVGASPWALAHGTEGPRAGSKELVYAKTADGFLGVRFEAASIVLVVTDGARKPIAVKEGAGTMFLIYVEDGHKSKLDLKLESTPEGSSFRAPIPAEAHGKTKVVAKVTADGKSHQGSFELEVPLPGK